MIIRKTLTWKRVAISKPGLSDYLTRTKMIFTWWFLFIPIITIEFPASTEKGDGGPY